MQLIDKYDDLAYHPEYSISIEDALYRQVIQHNDFIEYKFEALYEVITRLLERLAETKAMTQEDICKIINPDRFG